MGSDPQYAKYPNLNLSQDIFNLGNPSCPKPTKEASLKKLQDAISEHKMAPLYKHLAHPSEGILNATGEGSTTQEPTNKLSTATRRGSLSSNLLPNKKPLLRNIFSWDEQLFDSLIQDNEKELEALQKEEEEATEKAGETEIQAARGKRAEFWARVGDKVQYYAAFSTSPLC